MITDTAIRMPQTKESIGGLLTALTQGPPGKFVMYSHTGKKTIFSRWLAINRGRHSSRLRHSRKTFAQLALSEDAINPAIDGIACLDSGGPLKYFMVSGGEITPATKGTVQDLDDGMYALWHL